MYLHTFIIYPQGLSCYVTSNGKQGTHDVTIRKHTVRCRYNAVNFLPSPHEIHPIARPLGRGMVCNLWFDTLLYILLQSTQCRNRFRFIFDRVIRHSTVLLVIGPLLGESNSYLWIPPQRASNVDLSCFVCCKPEHTVELTVHHGIMDVAWQIAQPLTLQCSCVSH